ncbi:MAG: plastocyanin, partial [Rubrivivax sp.]
MKTLSAVACAAALALGLLANPAAAHGDADHPKNKEQTAVRKEQKPWGIAGDSKAVKRTIEFVMSDTMRFTPNRLDVRQGETVRIVLKNEGSLLHEFVLGTKDKLDEHAA